MQLRTVMAARARAQDLIDVGAYQSGTNPLVDAAVAYEDEINAFLRQRMDDHTEAEDAWSQLAQLDRLLGGA